MHTKIHSTKRGHLDERKRAQGLKHPRPPTQYGPFDRMKILKWTCANSRVAQISLLGINGNYVLNYLLYISYIIESKRDNSQISQIGKTDNLFLQRIRKPITWMDAGRQEEQEYTLGMSSGAIEPEISLEKGPAPLLQKGFLMLQKGYPDMCKFQGIFYWRLFPKKLRMHSH